MWEVGGGEEVSCDGLVQKGGGGPQADTGWSSLNAF